MARLNGKSCLKHLGAELDQAGLVEGRPVGGGGQGGAGALLSKMTETRPQSLPRVGGARVRAAPPRGGGSGSKHPIPSDAFNLRLQGRLAGSETDPSMVEGLRRPQTHSQKLKSLFPWWSGVLVRGWCWKRVIAMTSHSTGAGAEMGVPGVTRIYFLMFWRN